MATKQTSNATTAPASDKPAEAATDVTTPNLGGADAGGEGGVPNLGGDEKGAAPAPKPEDKPADIELKLPEGYKAADGEVDAFKALAKDLGLDSAKAQKLFDTRLKEREALQEQLASGAKAQVAEWGAALKADAELGGAKFAESFEVAKRGLAKFGTPELKALLRDTGLGAHPEVVRAFFRAGKAISEDSSAGARNGAAEPGAALMSDAAKARETYPKLYIKKE